MANNDGTKDVNRFAKRKTANCILIKIFSNTSQSEEKYGKCPPPPLPLETTHLLVTSLFSEKISADKRPTNHCLLNTSRLYRIFAPCAVPPVLTSKNEKGLFPRLLKVNKTTPGVATHKSQLNFARRNHVIFCRVQKFHFKSSEHIQEPLKFVFKEKEKLRIEEREEKLRFKQLRLDEQKRKDEFELEKLRIQTQSKLGADTSKESDTKFLVKEVSKFIYRFDSKEDISLYLKLFERQAQRINIDQENWVSHPLSLLPTEVSHIIAREPDDKANSYEHVKDLLLKRFKLTPEKFRQLFVTHQKAPERTWIDFYHELNTYFNGWVDGLKIDTFNKLSDLIITDQLKRKTPFEFKEYYFDEWANMNSPVQLAEKLEEFEDLKRTLKQKWSGPFVKKQESKFTEKNRRYEAPGKFVYNRKDKKFPASTNYNKHYEAPVIKYESVKRYQDSAQKGYYNKITRNTQITMLPSIYAQTNYSKSQKFKEHPKETCTLIVKEGFTY
ncbi:uncharacterized protein TNCV_5131851 [Trichonephila clavipes]|nr:uncharacterized protein TNCV_5131851 [Trichonephila clavipes]